MVRNGDGCKGAVPSGKLFGSDPSNIWTTPIVGVKY